MLDFSQGKSITFDFVMRIYLLGFMGSGKSTLGRKAATALHVPFFDSDEVVESQAGMSIPEIFNVHGELFFRHLEADVLRQTTFYPKSINAMGGGLPCFEDNMSWLKANGITIYLQWPDDVIKQHLMKLRSSRPLLSNLNDIDAGLKISELLSLRKPVYDQSAMTIKMNGDEEADLLLLEKACNYIW
jgi:shikimate kinase